MTGVDEPMYDAVVTELQSQWRFNYLNYGARWDAAGIQPQLRLARQVLFTSYRLNNLITLNAGYLEGENTLRSTDYIASYDDSLTVGASTSKFVTEGLLVTLHWQCWTTPVREVRTYVHLRNSQTGVMVAQEDGLPLMGLSNPMWWKPGDRWSDTRLVIMPKSSPAGKYELWVGVYPADGGARLRATDAKGNSLLNDEALVDTFVIQ